MLQELIIKNFAIIEDLAIHFEGGMTVLTGETGAGKSIIIDAVGLIAGGRGSAHFVRHGEEKCTLEALFTIETNRDSIAELCRTHGIDFEEDTLIIQRDIYASGRQVTRINGSMVTIAILKAVGSYLVDIHGQNEHQELMQAENHLRLLDSYGDPALQQAREAYRSTYQTYREKKKAYDNWQTNEQEANQRLDMLAFQIEEIEKANFEPGEEEALEEERNQLRNFQTVMEALSKAHQILEGDDEISGLSLIGQSMDELAAISEVHKDYEALANQVSESFYQLQEASSEIYSLMSDLEYDESRLNEIEYRLDLLTQLKRKYGTDIEEILTYLDDARKEFDLLSDREGQVTKLEQEVAALSESVVKKGKALSELRRTLSVELEENVHQQLKELYMEKVVFEVNFAEAIADYTIADAGPNGLDDVEFYISTNPGEPLKPLEKVASGGELSRMMLALKTIFSKKQGITSIIFDEVDTGVSGRVAQAIADKIYAVSKNSQVLCITHLPQVAARSDHHLYISKHVENDRTKTAVTDLTEDQKVEEVARMMSGETLTEATLSTAREMRAQHQ